MVHLEELRKNLAEIAKMKKVVDSKGQELRCGDIVLLEVNIDEPIKRLEYIEDVSKIYDDNKERLMLSCCWCPLFLLPQRIRFEGWKVTKVGTLKENPDYMKGRKAVYLEPCGHTQTKDHPAALLQDEKIKNEILNKIK